MRWLLCLLTIFALWMLLMWSVDPWTIGTGVFFSLIIGSMLGAVFPQELQAFLNPRRWLFFVIYVPYFFFYCVRANIDVMLRVIHPDVPIRPGIVKVQTTLTTSMGKTFLANSITLTPGTLTVDIDGQDLYIHWINIDTDDATKRSAEICGRFEPLLKRIFE